MEQISQTKMIKTEFRIRICFSPGFVCIMHEKNKAIAFTVCCAFSKQDPVKDIVGCSQHVPPKTQKSSAKLITNRQHSAMAQQLIATVDGLRETAMG